MSSVVIAGDTSGSITLQAPAVSGSTVLTLPTTSATLITDSSGILNIGSGQLYKDASGNVGIGTSSNSSGVKLEVYGSSTGLKVTGASSTTAFFQATSLGVQDWSFGTRTTGKFVFNTGNLLAGTDVLTIDPSGNVGIGTTIPAQLLHVRKDQAAYTWARVDNQSGSASAYSGWMMGASGNSWGITIGSAAANSNALSFVLDAGGANSEKMRINSSGNLLVGTTNDNGSSKATVLSNDAIGGGLAIATSSSLYRQLYLTSTGTVLQFWNGANQASLTAAGVWTNASDARLKKNIIDIKYGLETILATQPRSFERNDVAGKYIGFIAQELLPIIPEVVNGEADKQYCVDYGSLVAIAFKAIQELKAIIDTQQEQINSLLGK